MYYYKNVPHVDEKKLIIILSRTELVKDKSPLFITLSVLFLIKM